MPRGFRGRRGLTLVEIVVAMTLTLIVFAITLPFVRAQSDAIGANAGRLDAEQIARYAQRAIDRELRLATADPGQPMFVLAHPMGISFTANLLARDTLDPNALEVRQGGPVSLTEGWRVANGASLPFGLAIFPQEDYFDADGVLTRNETISWFLRPDTISGRNDIYVLYRRVNWRDSVQVVRGIYVPTDSSFFTYFRSVNGVLTQIPTASLPMLWTNPVLAEVRAVGMRVGGFYRNRVTQEDVVRTVTWRTVIPNAVSAAGGDCGAAPANPSSVAQSKQMGSASGAHVRVTWNASADDNGGDADVTHYIVRLRSEATGDTLIVASVPARAVASYRYEHYFPTFTGNVKYGVRAVDCGGAFSATVEHNSNLSLP